MSSARLFRGWTTLPEEAPGPLFALVVPEEASFENGFSAGGCRPDVTLMAGRGAGVAVLSRDGVLFEDGSDGAAAAGAASDVSAPGFGVDGDDGVAEADPSLATRRLRICSMVSWLGASGGGGWLSSVGSILSKMCSEGGDAF